MRRHMFLVLLCVVLATFTLRAFRLDFQSLWYDEAFSVYLAHFNLGEIAARTAADIQPPLYYYLLHLWLALAGDSEFSARFVSLFFGVLTVPLMYALARRLFPAPNQVGVGLIGALLAMLSPLYLWYSQEARMYTLITFLLLLSSYALVRALHARGRPRRWEWVCFTMANVAAVYTHYFAFAVIAFQLLWVILTSLNFRARGHVLKLQTLKPAGASFAAILLAFLPWTPFVVARFGQDASYWQGALKVDEALRHILINFTMGESVLEAQALWIALAWLAFLVVGWLASWFAGALGARRQPAVQARTDSLVPSSGSAFLLLYLVVPLALLLVLFYRNPKFNARYLMIASPAFLLLLAFVLTRVWSLTRHVSPITSHESRLPSPVSRLPSHRKASRRDIPRLVLFFLPFAFLLLTCLYSDANAYFDPAFTKADFRQVAQYIDAHLQPGEAIILTSGHLFPAFDYYYHGAAPQIRLPDDATLNTDHVLGYATANTLNQTLAGARGVWVVLWQDEVVDPNGIIPLLLASQGQEQELDGASFYQVRLRHWALPPAVHFSPEPNPTLARVANFNDKLQLLGATPMPAPADVGASFNLYWQALDTLGDDYQVALRVVDAAGNLWGKQDRRPTGYTYPTTRWSKGEKPVGAYTVPLLPGTPPGDYWVQLTVYTVANPSGLDVLAPNGAPVGKTVKLGPIPVLPASQPPTLASLEISSTLSRPLGPLTLLGYQLGWDQASAGETVPVTLFWRADQKPVRDYSFRLAFGSATTEPLALSNPQSPTTSWRAGETVRGQYMVMVPANAAVGNATLRLLLSDGSTIDLTSFTVVKTDRVFLKPSMQFSQSANFGNYLSLVGYDLSPAAKPGETLVLRMYWQARARTDKPYTVFVHLLDKDNQVRAQKDAQPWNGARPTTGWVANEYITDTYELALKPDAAPGSYQIEVGWYDASDFARLQVLDENGLPVNDHVILSTSLLVQ